MLKIKTLELKNFKRFENLRMEFNDVNILIGNNGSGKSSIIEAITYGLLPFRIKNSSNKIKYGKKEGFIKLQYEFQGKLYQSEVVLSKSKASYKLVCPDGLVLTKSTEIQDYLNNRHFNDKILYNSCISKQHLSASILEDSSVLLRLLLDMDVLTVFESRFKDYIRGLEEKRQNLSNILNNLNTKLKQFQSLKREDLPSIDFEKAKRILNKLIEKRNSYKEKLNLYLDLQNKFAQLDQLENEIKELYFSYKNLEAYKKLEIKLKNEKFYLQDNFNKFLEISKLRSRKAKILWELRKSKIQLRKIYLDIFSRPIFMKKTKVDKILATINSKIINLQNYLKLVNQGKCPTCLRPFTNMNLKPTLEKKLSFYLKIYNKIKNILDEYSKQYEEYLVLKNQITALEKVNFDLPKDNFLVLKNSYNRYRKIENLLNKISSRIKVLTQKELKIKALTEKYLALKKSLPTLVLEKPKVFTKDNLIDRIMALVSKETDYKKNEEIQNFIESTNKEILDVEAKISSLDKDISNLTQIYNTYKKEFIPFCINSYLEKFEGFLNSILDAIFENYRLSLSLKDRDLELFIKNQYGIIPIEELSGFEKQLVSLALRLAFTFFFKFNFLILDEADESASEENSKLLHDLLIEFVKNKNMQIIIISHKQFLKDLPTTINVEAL